jgi:hypothetical protein
MRLGTMSVDIEKELENIARCSEPVVFAGAGIPTASGIPAWKHLLQKLHYKTGEECPNEKVESWKPADYPKTAQILYDKFIEKDSTNGADNFLRSIRGILEPTIWDYSACQLFLVHSFDYIITTNFDKTFDTAIKDYNMFSSNKKYLIKQCVGRI